MRDPERIDPILEELRKIWKKNPDYRLGQMLVNFTKLTKPYYIDSPAYYVEDSVVEEGIKIWKEKTGMKEDPHAYVTPCILLDITVKMKVRTNISESSVKGRLAGHCGFNPIEELKNYLSSSYTRIEEVTVERASSKAEKIAKLISEERTWRPEIIQKILEENYGTD
jgi:hypothetical protein